MRNTRAVAAVLGCSVAMLLPLTACTSTPQRTAGRMAGASTAAATPSPGAKTSPTALPISFDGDDQVTLPDTDVREAMIAGDVLLTLAPQQIVARSLPDLDVLYERAPLDGSYADLWMAPGGDRVLSLETTSYKGTGTTVGADGFTVQEFDVHGGEVSRTTTAGIAKSSHGSAQAATGRIAGLVHGMILLDTWAGDQAHRTAAVAEGADRATWQLDDAAPLAVGRNRVLLALDGSSPALEGRDAVTGRVAWKELPGAASAYPLGVRDGALTVGLDTAGTPRLYRVDVGNGRVTDLGPDQLGHASCLADETVSVCSSDDRATIVARDLAGGKVLWSLPTKTRFAPTVTLVTGGKVYGALDSGQGVVLDARTGADQVDDSGAAPVAVGPYGAAALFGGTAFFVPVLPPGKSAAPTTGPSS